MAVLKLYVALKSSNIETVKEEINWSPFRKRIEGSINYYAKEVLNRSLKQQNKQISFSSTSVTRKIADEIATPEGMIFLFHNPKKYVDQVREIFKKASDPKYKKPPNPKKLNPPAERQPLKLEGPNIPDLRKRIDYFFFTDFSHFEADFKIENASFTIKWVRRGFDWKVETLGFSLASLN